MKDNDRLFAIKVISKAIIEQITLENLCNERLIYKKSKHPFVVTLRFAFQDRRNVYLGMDFLKGGDLHKLIEKKRGFPEDVARFFAAEVILGLEYLHTVLDVMYRDMKPENLLLDEDGHLKICDFGLSKLGKEKSYSICGTRDYLAPEVLESESI